MKPHAKIIFIGFICHDHFGNRYPSNFLFELNDKIPMLEADDNTLRYGGWTLEELETAIERPSEFLNIDMEDIQL